MQEFHVAKENPVTNTSIPYTVTCEQTAFSNIYKMHYEQFPMSFRVDNTQYQSDLCTEEGMVQYFDRKHLCIGVDYKFLSRTFGNGFIPQVMYTQWWSPSVLRLGNIDYYLISNLEITRPFNIVYQNYIDQIAIALKSGRGVLLKANVDYLYEHSDKGILNKPNHTIAITGIVYDSKGKDIKGFYVCDPGRSYEAFNVHDIDKFKPYVVSVAYIEEVFKYSLSSNILITKSPLNKKVWSNNIDGTANNEANVLVGNDGNNTIEGLSGNDIYIPEPINNGGEDHIVDSSGSDLYLLNLESGSMTYQVDDSDGQGGIFIFNNSIKDLTNDYQDDIRKNALKAINISETDVANLNTPGNIVLANNQNNLKGANKNDAGDYIGEFKEVYKWNGTKGTTLTIEFKGNTIFVNDFSNGSLGITLTDKPQGGGPTGGAAQMQQQANAGPSGDPLAFDLNHDGVISLTPDKPRAAQCSPPAHLRLAGVA
jgi:hypothetical protein